MTQAMAEVGSKKLLIIGLPVADYIASIESEARLQGYDVKTYNIEPWSPYRKVLRRLAPQRLRAERDREHAAVIEREKSTTYDVVLFIQCHQMSYENLATLRRLQPRAKFVLYNWDSLTTFDYSSYVSYFDRVATFDHADAKQIGVEYLPLFCIRELQPNGTEPKSGPHVYFVGKVESARRYMPMRKFKKYCTKNEINFDCYMVAPRWSIYLQLLSRGVIPSDLNRKTISKAELRTKMDNASAVFDYANYAQTGFTMRVIENLCAGKRLITGSKNIVNEDFYSPDRVFVFDPDTSPEPFEGVKEFLCAEPVHSDKVLERYYIQNFVADLLS